MSKSIVEYQKSLVKLQALLAVPLTAKQAAKRLRCAPVSVYRQIDALMGMGVRFDKKRVRASKTGPKTITWQVRP